MVIMIEMRSVLSELPLVKAHNVSHFVGLLAFAGLWRLFKDQRTRKEQKKSLAWWNSYQGYLSATL